jgi:hypothetical protein
MKEPKNPTKEEPVKPSKGTAQERPSKQQKDEGKPKK